MSRFLVYGANGYTGSLIARKAIARGQRPILAGRNEKALQELAHELGLEARVFGLENPAAIDDGIQDAAAVLHCAGPFSSTSQPMASACLRRKVHYLDITGEALVFEQLSALDGAARAAQVMLLPGAGFDVVPSDCLAAHLKRRLPSATHLALGFQASGPMSRGTMRTIAENLHRGGLVRQEGMLRKVPAAWKSRVIDFGSGPCTAVTIPWGDVVTAFLSTGIASIEVYTPASPLQRGLMRVSRHFGRLLGSSFVQDLLRRRIQGAPAGPTAEERKRGRTSLWGEAANTRGEKVVSRLEGPEGYTFTVRAALAIMERVLSGEAPVGFQTPSRAYGPDLVLTIDGVRRTDE